MTNPSSVIKDAESVLMGRNVTIEAYSATNFNTQVIGDTA